MCGERGMPFFEETETRAFLGGVSTVTPQGRNLQRDYPSPHPVAVGPAMAGMSSAGPAAHRIGPAGSPVTRLSVYVKVGPSLDAILKHRQASTTSNLAQSATARGPSQRRWRVKEAKGPARQPRGPCPSRAVSRRPLPIDAHTSLHSCV